VIKPKSGLFDLRLKELWRYRDLTMMFVRRDFVSIYKQTILGPLWFFVQPLLTTIMFIIIFGRVAKLSTDGMPMVIFYLSGITIWNYFSLTLTSTSSIFVGNAHIFGKVYFPRLTMPLSIVIHPKWYILLTPVLLVMMGLLSLGFGLIFSSLTTKYRDLSMLLAFGVQLLMYATPVIYPLSSVPEKYKWIIVANPITSIVETFRYAFLGSGSFSWLYLGYSAVVSIVILLTGVIIFNKVGRSFIDVV
jgi:lipopolysaccharide transport system permease protein